MTRRNRLGLLLLALAAVCAAAAAAVLLSPEETAEEDTSFPLLELEAEDITQLSWSYGGQTQSFTYDPEDGWSYPADSAFPLDPALLESMADALSQLTAYRAIEEAEDLSQYGLEEPQARVSFTADGSQYTLDIGVRRPWAVSGMSVWGRTASTSPTPPCWTTSPAACTIWWHRRRSPP